MSENRPKPYLGNPQETIAVLNRYKFAFQKKFGQNFLTGYRNHDTVSCLRSP